MVDFLGNVDEQHITHGRLITAAEVQGQRRRCRNCSRIAGEQRVLAAVVERYVRCEVFLKLPPPKAKLIETADVSVAFN